jgi:acyl carrier protein
VAEVVDMDEIVHAVLEVIVQKLGIYTDKVALGASFYEDIGVDSLDVMELMMALEDRFEITIPDEALGEIKTVEDAVNAVRAYG